MEAQGIEQEAQAAVEHEAKMVNSQSHHLRT